MLFYTVIVFQGLVVIEGRPSSVLTSVKTQQQPHKEQQTNYRSFCTNHVSLSNDCMVGIEMAIIFHVSMGFYYVGVLLSEFDLSFFYLKKSSILENVYFWLCELENLHNQK